MSLLTCRCQNVNAVRLKPGLVLLANTRFEALVHRHIERLHVSRASHRDDRRHDVECCESRLDYLGKVTTPLDDARGLHPPARVAADHDIFQGRLHRPAFPASRGGSAPLLTPPRFLLPLLLCKPYTWTCGASPTSLDRVASATFDDYTRYTTVFPLQSKADFRGVLIHWIRAARLQLRAQFREDLPVLRLHSDQGGEFFSRLLEDLCGAEGIVQSYTLLASPQQSGIAERRIGLVMEVTRTSMIHAAAPHFLWPFAVRYAAAQLNLWLRVSHPETSPTLRWKGEVGDASAFWSLVPLPPLSLVDDPPLVAPLPPPGPAPSGVSQVDPPPLVKPLEVSSDTSCPAERGDQTATNTVARRRSEGLAVPPGFQPRPSSPPLRPFTVDSCAAGGGDTAGADSGGAGSGGAASPTGEVGAGGAAAGDFAGEGPGGVGTSGAGAGGASARRQETLSPERLCEWAVHWGSPGGGAGRSRATGSGGAGPGGASAGVPRVGRVGGTGAGGTGATGGTGGAAAVGAAAGCPSSRRQEPLSRVPTGA
ncbi:unnamed protein product [Closterium sp. NIES-53]